MNRLTLVFFFGFSTSCLNLSYPDAGCAESPASLCARNTRSCGTLTTTDFCLALRTVDCGACEGALVCTVNGVCAGVTATGGGSATGGGTSATGGGTSATGGGTSATGGGTSATDGGTSATGGGTSATGGGTGTCSAGCPTGFICSGRNTCVGGNQTALAWQVTSVPVTMTIQNNATVPSATCTSNSDSVAFVTLTKSATDWNSFGASCPSPQYSTTWGMAPNETWNVEYKAGYAASNLPNGTLTLPPLTITGPMTRVFDFHTVTVSGQVTSNGAQVSCPYTGSIGTVYFKNTSTNAVLQGDLRCTVGGHPTYSASVPAATYKIFVEGFSTANLTLPTLPTPVTSASISNSTSLSLDATSFLATFRFTLNGLTPADDCAANPSGYAKLEYSAQGDGVVGGIGYSIGCNASTYTATQYVGPGSLTMRAGSSRNNLPGGQQVVLNIVNGITTYSMDLTGFHVAGSLSVNNAPLSACTSYSSVSAKDPAAVSGDFGHDLKVDCATSTFSGWLKAGTYALVVSQQTSSDLPFGSWVMPLTVNSNLSNLALKVTTVPITITSLANGATPSDLCGGASASASKYSFDFKTPGPALATSNFIYATCSETGFKKTVNAYPGTFTVTVNSTRSTLPAFGAMPNITVASAGDLTLDFPSRHVSGTVSINGIAQGCTVGAIDGNFFVDPLKYLGSLSCTSAGTLAFDTYLSPGTYTFTAAGGNVTQFPRGLRVLGSPVEIQ